MHSMSTLQTKLKISRYLIQLNPYWTNTLCNTNSSTTTTTTGRRLQQQQHHFSTSTHAHATGTCYILGAGNPLLDHTVFLSEKQIPDVFGRYQLKPNDQILVGEAQINLFSDLHSNRLHSVDDPPKKIQVPGGATLNTIRVAQWLLRIPQATAYIGAIGDDEHGKMLCSSAEELGVDMELEVHIGQNTGQCAALVHGDGQTYVNDLGAALQLRESFLMEPRVKTFIEKASIVYAGGYLWPRAPGVIQTLAQHCVTNHRCLAMNLHAAFLCAYFADSRYHLVLPAVDYLFGNETEALAFAHCMAQQSPESKVRQRFSEFLNMPVASTPQLERIGLYTSQLVKASPGSPRTVIITQGGKGPVVVCRGEETMLFPVNSLSSDQLIDPSGCGDAFVGSFLSLLSLGASVPEAVRLAIDVGRIIAQNYGCTFPRTIPAHIEKHFEKYRVLPSVQDSPVPSAPS